MHTCRTQNEIIAHTRTRTTSSATIHSQPPQCTTQGEMSCGGRGWERWIPCHVLVLSMQRRDWKWSSVTGNGGLESSAGIVDVDGMAKEEEDESSDGLYACVWGEGGGWPQWRQNIGLVMVMELPTSHVTWQIHTSNSLHFAGLEMRGATLLQLP